MKYAQKPGFFKKPGFSVPHEDENRYLTRSEAGAWEHPVGGEFSRIRCSHLPTGSAGNSQVPAQRRDVGHRHAHNSPSP